MRKICNFEAMSVCLHGLVLLVASAMLLSSCELSSKDDGRDLREQPDAAGTRMEDECDPACPENQTCHNGVCVLEEIQWSADEYTVQCEDGMCLVPSGPFMMGCNEGVDDDCRPHERPYHEVDLDAFWIDREEVTQREYQECVDAGGCHWVQCWQWLPGDETDKPVTCVWPGSAEMYCEGVGKRLPTEAEWEKAARGTDGRKFPWGNEPATCDRAVMAQGGAGCGTDSLEEPCSRETGNSPYGICDMAGNSYEWVSDEFHCDYYENSPTENPQGSDKNSAWRIFRGGSFINKHEASLRASDRAYAMVSFAHFAIGFRCARDAE